MTPSMAGFGRRPASRTRNNTKREVMAALEPLRQVTVAARSRPAVSVFAQASGPGAVAGQRPGPEPAVRRLVRLGRYGVSSQLSLDLQGVGQAPFFQSPVEIDIRAVASVRNHYRGP